MKPFIAAFSLHIILLYVCARFDIYRQNPLFFVWLLLGVAVNISLAVLGWTRALPAFDRLLWIYEVTWYALMVGIIFWAFTHYSNAASPAILKGTLALVALTVMGRLITASGVIGHASKRLEDAANLAYLIPTIYLILALSPIRIDPIAAFHFLNNRAAASVQFAGAFIHARSNQDASRLS